jgi:hypothetical protein
MLPGTLPDRIMLPGQVRTVALDHTNIRRGPHTKSYDTNLQQGQQ